jgi:hypothetical protein
LFRNILEEVLYAIWQAISRAYTVLARAQGNELMLYAKYSMPFGKEYPELNTQLSLCRFGKGSGQWDYAYAFCQAFGEHSKQLISSSATYTVPFSSRGKNAQSYDRAQKQGQVAKVPLIQLYYNTALD